MRVPRVFVPSHIGTAKRVLLDSKGTQHLRVLRLQAGAALTVFDGQGGEYPATLIELKKHQATVEVGTKVDRTVESPLKITLGQAVARGEKMDLTIQKAVELGVAAVQPLLATRCGVKLEDKAKVQSRLQHWQSIVASACEQCGRNTLPPVLRPLRLEEWLTVLPSSPSVLKLVLHPHSTSSSLGTFAARRRKPTEVVLLVGSEGGLTEPEIESAVRSGFAALRIGPRVLRTETAGLAALSALQTTWGDFT